MNSNILDEPLHSDNQVAAGPVLTRAGVEAKPRLVLMTSIGGLWGFAIGTYLGGKQTSFQYLAENAHKLPTTVQGWYFYHKTKNYKVILGGIKRGARMAIPTGAICLAYGAIEAGLDDVRKEADVFNSVMAGMGTGILFSAMSKSMSVLVYTVTYVILTYPSTAKLSRNSLKRSVMVGIYGGLVAGGLNDLHRAISGDTPSYVKWLKGSATESSS
jgi:hypothetical protein